MARIYLRHVWHEIMCTQMKVGSLSNFNCLTHFLVDMFEILFIFFLDVFNPGYASFPLSDCVCDCDIAKMGPLFSTVLFTLKDDAYQRECDVAIAIAVWIGPLRVYCSVNIGTIFKLHIYVGLTTNTSIYNPTRMCMVTF